MSAFRHKWSLNCNPGVNLMTGLDPWENHGDGPRCLPGQRVLHVLFCTDMPSQKAPPLRGAGFVQVRERFCTPRPQRTLQGDQSVHDDQPPFTGWRDEQTKPDNILCLTMYFLSWTPAPLTAGFTQRSRWTVKKKKRCLSKDDQWCLPLHWSLWHLLLWFTASNNARWLTYHHGKGRNTTFRYCTSVWGYWGSSRAVGEFISIEEINDWWVSTTGVVRRN